MPKFDAPLDMDGSRIHNVVDPATAQDAATKGYVDGQVGAGSGSPPFEFDQNAPATTWTVVHNLGYFPAVTTVDSLGREFYGTITYISANSLTISFSVALTGKVYLS